MARLPDSFFDDDNDDTAPVVQVPKGWSVDTDDTEEENDVPEEPEAHSAPEASNDDVAYPETLEKRLPRLTKRSWVEDWDDADDVPALVAKPAPKKRSAYVEDDFGDEDETPLVKRAKQQWAAEAEERATVALDDVIDSGDIGQFDVAEPEPYVAPAKKEVIVPVKPLSERALLVSLNISQWSGRRFDRDISNEVNAQKAATSNAGRFNKMLLPDCAELAEVHRQTSSLRNWFVEKTMPWMNDGARITPSATYLDFTSEFRRREAEWVKAVDALIAAYPSLKAKAPQQLQSMYNPDDYPMTYELRSKFSMAIRAFPLPSKDDFRVDLDPATMAALKDSMADVEGDLARQVVGECYQRLGKAVGAMAERLGDPDAVFRNSLVENLAEAVSALKDLNITGDPQLETLRRNVEKTLGGYNADQLRSSVTTRKAAADSAKLAVEEINRRMAGLY